jgi:hypothetical protein
LVAFGSKLPKPLLRAGAELRPLSPFFRWLAEIFFAASLSFDLTDAWARRLPSILSLSKNSRFAYVSVSRASHDAQIYTNSAASLAENLSHDVSKSAAVDFSQSLGRAVSEMGSGASPLRRSVSGWRKASIWQTAC